MAANIILLTILGTVFIVMSFATLWFVKHGNIDEFEYPGDGNLVE